MKRFAGEWSDNESD